MWIIAQEELHALITEAARHVDANAFSRDVIRFKEGHRPLPDRMHNFLKGRMLATLVDLQRRAFWLFTSQPGVTVSGIPLRFIAGQTDAATEEVRMQVLRTYADAIPFMFHDPKNVIHARGLVRDCLEAQRSTVAVAKSIRAKVVEREGRRKVA